MWRVSYCEVTVGDINNGFSLSRFLPYVGMVTIVMNDYPWLKVGLCRGGGGGGGGGAHFSCVIIAF